MREKVYMLHGVPATTCSPFALARGVSVVFLFRADVEAVSPTSCVHGVRLKSAVIPGCPDGAPGTVAAIRVPVPKSRWIAGEIHLGFIRLIWRGATADDRQHGDKQACVLETVHWSDTRLSSAESLFRQTPTLASNCRMRMWPGSLAWP